MIQRRAKTTFGGLYSNLPRSGLVGFCSRLPAGNACYGTNRSLPEQSATSAATLYPQTWIYVVRERQNKPLLGRVIYARRFRVGALWF